MSLEVARRLRPVPSPDDAVDTSAAGAVAGALAAVPMLGVMALLNRTLPGYSKEHRLPPMKITRRVAEESGIVDDLPPPGQQAAGFAAHLGFGGATGSIFGQLAARFPRLARRPVASGIGFGLLVWAVSYAGWLPGLGLFPPAHRRTPRRNATIILAHVAWGALLGPLTLRLHNRHEGSAR